MATIVKGEKRGRPGKWIVDYRDPMGERRWKTFDTRREAEDYIAEVIPQSRQRIAPTMDRDMTVQEYADHWLKAIRHGVKESTVTTYEAHFSRNILPVFGTLKVRELDRGRIKRFYVNLGARLSKASVKLVHATLSGMLTSAVDDGLLLANPADKLTKKLKLAKTKAQRQEDVKAFTREQRDRFLDTAKRVEPDFYTQFLCLFMTGLRLGESLGLEWDDLQERSMCVARTVDSQTGNVGTPKGGKSRNVDMNVELIEALRRWKVRHAEKALKEGRGGELPARVFPMPSAKSGGASRLLQPPLLPPQLRQHLVERGRRSAPLRTGATRARLNPRDGGHLRQVAAEGWQGSGGHPLHDGLEGCQCPTVAKR